MGPKWRFILGAVVLFVLGAIVDATINIVTQDPSPVWLAVTGAVVAVGSTLIGWQARREWVAARRAEAGGADRLDAAAARLAESSRTAWKAEAQLRSISPPVELPPRWHLSARPVWGAAAGLPTRSPEGNGLAELLQLVGTPSGRQVVILGEPGSGKTVLAVLLVLELLEPPQGWGPGRPVPVLFPLSSYRPGSSLRQWMTVRLTEDHPVLSENFGPDIAGRLIADGRILPVFDGLDELQPSARAGTVAAIGAAVGAAPLLLTCRGDEYEAAVTESNEYLRHAQVIEIEQVGAEAAIDYLRSGVLAADQRWHPVFDRIRAEPDGAVAQTFTTPLMLFLARVAYTSPLSDPAELLDSRFGRREQVEDHLLQRFVPAVYDARLDPAYTAERAERWLRTLAGRSRDLRWWQMRSPIAAIVSIGLFTAGSAWMFWLAWGVKGAVTSAVFVGGMTALSCFPGVSTWVEITSAEKADATPRSDVRDHRMVAGLWAALSGLFSGAVLGALFASTLRTSGWTTLVYASVLGLFSALGTLTSTAWGGYVLTRLWLAMTRRLPRDLLDFLDDAHRRRGVLRQAGAVYQFRHARLQEALGGTPIQEETKPTRSDAPYWLRRVGHMPLLRLTIVAFSVFMIATVAGLATGTVMIEYRSGRQPEIIAGDVSCVPDGSACGSGPDTWAWRLPAGAGVATGFRITSASGDRPFTGFAGSVFVDGCPGAVVQVVMRIDSPSKTLVATVNQGGPTALKMDRDFPSKFDAFTLDFRRLDSAQCVARFAWSGPAISSDGLYDLRRRI